MISEADLGRALPPWTEGSALKADGLLMHDSK